MKRSTLSQMLRPALLVALLALALLLAAGATSPARAAFPGNNGQIAFVSAIDSSTDSDPEIFTMNADGSNQLYVTNNSATDFQPAWSPDGLQIAFTSERDGNYNIYVMNADGSGQVGLTSDGASDSEPAWSPDGSQIAFSSIRDGNYEVYVMNADGTGQTNLTNAPASHDSEPAWSPDGSQIAFTSNRDGNLEVYVMAADGTGQTNVTGYPASLDTEPAWSPDGSQIVFTSHRDLNYEVYVMAADGTGQTNLTNNAAFDAQPAWSPDGQYIAFTTNSSGDEEIYRMAADGTGQTNLTNYPDEHSSYPDWQPVQPLRLLMSTSAAGVTDDAVAYGPHDILMWEEGSGWSKWFDGSLAGLTPNGKAAHNVNAFYAPDLDDNTDLYLSFAQHARRVRGIEAKVDGTDIVHWDGTAFSLWFDGFDVGLTNKSQEKIDALHVLDGSLSPVGAGCSAYLLISTQGPGKVPGETGPFKFGGEDVLGFCMLNSGPATAGIWHKLIDGRDEGLPPNSVSGLGATGHGLIYLTTNGSIEVDQVAGGHSTVFSYNRYTGEFEAVHFVAADHGLHSYVDGVHAGK